MRYGIIGSGALGAYYGGCLANAGKEVHFLFNSDFEHVTRHGLKVDSVKGDFLINPINAYKSSQDMPKCDVVLVCLKTNNNKLLAELLPPILHEDTIVILIQNGLGIEADLQTQLPNANIAGGLAFICSHKIGDGHIKHLDYGKLNIGAYTKINTLKLFEISNDFEEANIEAEIVDLAVARWEKLVWNIPFNGLAVVLNTSTDKILQDTATRQLVYDMMQEVILAASYAGSKLLPNLADRMLDMTDQMAPYSPSMKLDFDNRRPLEIHYIYTKPVAEAILAGIEMPRVSMLEKQLKFIESQYIVK